MTPQASVQLRWQKRDVLWWGAGALTLAGVVAGLGLLSDYNAQPGLGAVAPATWPIDSLVPRAVDRPTVVLFAHPLCPCTRASLSELNRVMGTVGDDVASRVVFTVDGGLNALPGEDAVEGSPALIDRARHIAGTILHFDADGAESGRFGSATSGQVLAYDTAGRLIFSGGITGSRGHEGENAGSTKLLAALKGDGSASATSPVFGCSLKTPTELNANERPKWMK